MDSALRGPAARAVGLATAIAAVAALLLGLMASALGSEATSAGGSAPPATAAVPGATPPAVSSPSTAPPGASPDGPAQGSVRVPGPYVVVAGDTLAAIADRSGVPVELIAQDSGVTDPDDLAVGQVLTLSTPPSNVVVVVPGSSISDYAQQLSTTVENLLALNPQIRDPDVVLAGSGLRTGTD